jgi:hypothetical protein
MCITGRQESWMADPWKNQTKPTTGFAMVDICIFKQNTIRNKNEKR